MIKYLLLASLPLVLVATLSFSIAQQAPVDDTKAIEKAAKRNIKEFVTNLSNLGQSSNDSLKVIYRKTIKKLFKPGAKIEVINLAKKKRSYSIDEYLQVVSKYSKRFRLVVFRVESFSIEKGSLKPKKTRDGEIIGYEGTYNFSQIWCVSDKQKEGNKYDAEDFSVCERTKKTGKFYLEKKHYPSEGEKFVLLLGDIQADEIEEVK